MKEVTEYEFITVPCGTCYDCKKKRSSQWSFRLEQEMVHHDYRYFVTLTYSDESLVYGEGDNPTLVKKDLQNYFKRLRKITPRPIKYYAVGEYGTQFKRPHYHIILMGAKPQQICDAWTLNDIPIGNVDIGDITPASIRYVTNYVMKPSHKKHGIENEFSLMSKGLGKSYMSEKIVKYYHETLNPYITLKDGIKRPMPRYYKDKIFSKEQKKQIQKNINSLIENTEETPHMLKKSIVETNERKLKKSLLKR